MIALAELTTTTVGIWLIAVMAAAIVLIWDWRVTLISIFCVQSSLAMNSALVQGLPFHWALVESAVMGLACLILAMSANRVGDTPSQFQSGTWMLRLMTMALVVVAWQALKINLQLPEIDLQVSRLYAWIGVCALVTMSMSNSPFFIGAGLLLWLIPVQAATSAILAIPSLTASLGMLELLVALACSYLILIELEPERSSSQILTDVVFPSFAPNAERQRARRPVPMPHRQIRSWTSPPDGIGGAKEPSPSSARGRQGDRADELTTATSAPETEAHRHQHES